MKYYLINKYSKHGVVKSMEKLLKEKFNLTMYAENYFIIKKFIYSVNKRIVNADIEDIELYGKSILNVMDYLINGIRRIT